MEIELTHGKEYFSPSQLKRLSKSADDFQAYLDSEFKASKAMEFGTLVHAMALEPETIDSRYVMLDDASIIEEIGGKRPTATAKYAEFLLEFTKANEGKEIITKEVMDKAKMLYNKLLISGVYDSFLEGGISERKVTQKVSLPSGRTFNALAIIDKDMPEYSVEVKTTSKDLSKFKWDARDLGYDIAAAVSHLINGKDVYFVVIQTELPYRIGVFKASRRMIESGIEKIEKALDNYEVWKSGGIQIYEEEL